MYNYTNILGSIRCVVSEKIISTFLHFTHRHVPVKQFPTIKHFLINTHFVESHYRFPTSKKVLIVQSNTNFPYFTIQFLVAILD